MKHWDAYSRHVASMICEHARVGLLHRSLSMDGTDHFKSEGIKVCVWHMRHTP